MLFYPTEQCQEIQTIGQDPYSSTHIINVIVHLLMQSGIFPIKKFKTWAAVPNKTYPGLKKFIHEAYTQRLTAISLCNTVGSLGYMGSNQNAFNVIYPLAMGDIMDINNATTVTQTEAAANMGSTFAASAASRTFPEEITAAIQQLAANQTSMMQQFAAFSINPHMAQCNNLHVPPVHNIHVPAQQAGGFQQQPGRFQQGRGGRRGSGCSQGGGQGRGRGGRGCTTYNTGFVPQQFVPQFKGHIRYSGLGQIQVELPLCLPVDMPQPEEVDVTQNTPTEINSTTTGTCVTHMGLMPRTGTHQQRVNIGRWTTRRASHAKMCRGTLMQDMLLAQRECIKMCC